MKRLLLKIIRFIIDRMLKRGKEKTDDKNVGAGNQGFLPGGIQKGKGKK